MSVTVNGTCHHDCPDSCGWTVSVDDAGPQRVAVKLLDPGLFHEPEAVRRFERETELRRRLIAEGDHLAKLPGGVDVKEREGRLAYRIGAIGACWIPLELLTSTFDTALAAEADQMSNSLHWPANRY